MPRRRRNSLIWSLILLALLVLPGPASAQTGTTPPDSLYGGKHFGRAALEVLGTNLTVWSYDRFIREGGELSEFRVGTNSIWNNLENQWEWDNNNFPTNNFAHPYHGSLYFNAARSNGFSYWESMPFAFAGSFLWEFTGEVNNPAYNDWINTSVGGAALGEALFRLSDLVLDDTATGAERFWREMGGLCINPMRGVNRLISGRWGRVGLNPEGRHPNQLGTLLAAGWRSQSRERVGVADTSGIYLEVDFFYGDPYQDRDIQPFDNFKFHAQVNFHDRSRLGHVRSQGLLTGRHLDEGPDRRRLLGTYQAFEFIDNRGFEFGGQTLGAAYLTRFGDGGTGWGLHTETGLGWLLLAGTSSEVENFSGREYDYGTGLSFDASLGLRHRGWTVLEFSTQGHWLKTLNGPSGSYFVSFTSLQAMVPVHRHLGIGAEIQGCYRHARYREFGNVDHWLPEARLFAIWSSF